MSRIDVLMPTLDVARVADALEIGGENPGIGGTQWVMLQQALRLQRSGAFDVRVVVVGRPRSGALGPLELAVVRDLDDVVADGPAVARVAGADVGRLGMAWAGRPLVVGLHHPHAVRHVRVASRLRPSAFVSVGGYAFHSNRTGLTTHHWVPDPFPHWALAADDATVVARTATPPAGPPVFGFVGALIPGKGLHLVARAWRDVRQALPDARLEVIGSSSLYGFEPEHPVVPASNAYGERVLRAFGPGIGSVTFHGRVARGKAALMAGWDVALLNPTGETEADPSSLKEVIAAGVVPVAAADLGMWDVMRHLPGTSVSAPSRMAAVAVAAATDPAMRRWFLDVRRAILDEALARDRDLEARWIEVLERAVPSDARSSSERRPLRDVLDRPDRPRGRIRVRMVRRSLKEAVLGRLSKDVVGRLAALRVSVARRGGAP